MTYWTLNGPLFFRVGEVLFAWVFHPLPGIGSRLLAQISRHEWQADDRTRFAAGLNLRETISKALFSKLARRAFSLAVIRAKSCVWKSPSRFLMKSLRVPKRGD
jgi:hypothetical protein